MDFQMHEYTHALVSKVKPGSCHGDEIDFDDTRRQHECYLRLLSELNVEVMEMDLQGSFKENLLLEDLAVICHGIALLPKPSSPFEQNNMKILKDFLIKDLGQTVIEQVDPDASICGSDVLFTGQEFFVGISDTTNEAGASVIAESFPEFPCTPIKVSKGAHHLKKYITVAGPDILCIGASKEAKELLKRMEREATFSYQTLTVPEDEAANCLYMNGTLVHRAIEEIPESFKGTESEQRDEDASLEIPRLLGRDAYRLTDDLPHETSREVLHSVFCEKIDFARRSICFSELAKLSAGLSSCCLLVRKS